MDNAAWFLLVGGLLVAMGLSRSTIRSLPVTSAMIYLSVGLLVGPTGLNAFHFNPLKQAALLETLTEVAVLISLFAAGVKMPVPFHFAQWRAPILLATVSMSVTVALVTLFAHYLLELPLGAAILLGAIVAPTDPVLATDVQSRHPGDRSSLRFTLTCEAGMNDGSAFPFVMLGLGLLGLHEIGEFGLRWALQDVLWATAAGIAIGVTLGHMLARLSWRLRRQSGHELLDDFLGLGLIGVVYGASELLHAWGFLAVFFAAVALSHTEHALGEAHCGAPSALIPELQPESGDDAGHRVLADKPQTISEGALVFKEHLERLSEVLLVLLVGGALFLDSWSWRAVGFALFLFLVARPVSVLLGLTLSRTSWTTRGMVAWFGVRGIGSLYYLMFAIVHGLPQDLALKLMHLTLVVVALSIVLHGSSVKPMLSRLAGWRRRFS